MISDDFGVGDCDILKVYSWNAVSQKWFKWESTPHLSIMEKILEEINMLTETHINLERIDITADQRFYELPSDYIRIIDVRCKNHLNSKDEYRGIPRLLYEPRIVDADGS